MLLQLGLREKVHARGSSLYDNLSQLQKRLQNFAEVYDDPREVRLVDVEPDFDNRVFLIRKKIWELKDNEISFKQIEFWKNEEWYIKRDRPGPTLYNGTVNSTLKGCWSDKRKTHDTIKCFNYGFCFSPEVMMYFDWFVI